MKKKKKGIKKAERKIVSGFNVSNNKDICGDNSNLGITEDQVIQTRKYLTGRVQQAA